MSTVCAKQELNANIIGFGGKIVGDNLIYDIIDAFITTLYKPTPGNRNLINKIDSINHSDLSNQTGNTHFFDEELKKWNKNYYHD